MQERERRQASDTRTEAQRWLGDPPPSQSALAQNNVYKTVTQQRHSSEKPIAISMLVAPLVREENNTAAENQ
jgi:hypothetical protein